MGALITSAHEAVMKNATPSSGRTPPEMKATGNVTIATTTPRDNQYVIPDPSNDLPFTANAKGAFERTTAARSHGRQPAASRQKPTFARRRVAFDCCNCLLARLRVHLLW